MKYFREEPPGESCTKIISTDKIELFITNRPLFDQISVGKNALKHSIDWDIEHLLQHNLKTAHTNQRNQ